IYTQTAGQFVNITPAGKIALDFDTMFRSEIKGFLNAAAGTEPCRAPAEDGVELMRIIDAIYESAKTGKSVEISR
ncbi:MAG: gfo/Idh/MocA family oxidoreductase, partial [Firmicutes bacterium]|nr:gfo/Idh/MocA family oxidoreductase [Candidatus Colimorpha enterica]